MTMEVYTYSSDSKSTHLSEWGPVCLSSTVLEGEGIEGYREWLRGYDASGRGSSVFVFGARAQ